MGPTEVIFAIQLTESYGPHEKVTVIEGIQQAGERDVVSIFEVKNAPSAQTVTRSTESADPNLFNNLRRHANAASEEPSSWDQTDWAPGDWVVTLAVAGSMKQTRFRCKSTDVLDDSVERPAGRACIAAILSTVRSTSLSWTYGDDAPARLSLEPLRNHLAAEDSTGESVEPLSLGD